MRADTERLDELGNWFARYRDFSGVVLAGIGDDIVWLGAYGKANAELDTPVTSETVFRLASLSKQFTAAALVLLSEQEKVNLHVPISSYLPDLNPDLAGRITIHHLLSHTSGLVRDIEELTNEDLALRHVPMEELITLIGTSSLQFEPGSRWSYSNPGYALAAAVIESVTGLPYGEAMDSLLFTPLGLTHTGHETGHDVVKGRADGYVDLPDGWIRARHEDKSYVIGAGSLYSTATDIFRWIRALRSGNVLSPSGVERLFTPYSERYGYGWFVDSYVWPPKGPEDSGRSLHHGGDSPGFTSNLSIYDEHDLVVIMMSNVLPSAGNELSNRVGNLLLGFDDALPTPPDFRPFYLSLLDDGVKATMSRVREWTERGESFRIPSSYDVYITGRGFLDARRFSEAIRLMDALIAWRPTWTYPYLFKGIALAQSGFPDSASKQFDKVLELDPGQSNALSWLKKLEAGN